MDYEELKSRIKGPVFPVVTPFKDNGGIDYVALKLYLDFLYAGGARIFHVMVHTSRFGLLSPLEMLGVNQCVATHVKMNFDDCVVIAADPLYKSTQVSVEFAQQAEEFGADAIGLIFLERFYSYDQPYEFFKTVANSCNIGVLIHEQPLATINGAEVCNWPLGILKRICEIDNVVAIKEDAKDDVYTKNVVRALGEKVAVIVSGGSKEQFMEFGPMGAQAYLVGTASFDPALGVEFYENYVSGLKKFCWRTITKTEMPFFAVAKHYGWHPALKSALELLGIMSRVERPPLVPLNHYQHDCIRGTLRRIGYEPQP